MPRFFKAVEGDYGEGDRFIGVRVPWQRKVARKYYMSASMEDIAALLHDEVHEYRSVALIMLVYKYQKAASAPEREGIVRFYLDNLDYVNNWDLVDLSADKILGAHLYQGAHNFVRLGEFGHSGDSAPQLSPLSTSSAKAFR